MQKHKIKNLDSIQTVTESGYFIFPGRECTEIPSPHFPCLQTYWKQEWVQICVVLRWGSALSLPFSVFPMCIRTLTVGCSPFASRVFGCCVSSSAILNYRANKSCKCGVWHCLNPSLPSSFPVTSMSERSPLNETAASLLANGRGW